MGVIENEFHFVLVCPNDYDLRRNSLNHSFVIGQLYEKSKLFCVTQTLFNYQINLYIWLLRKEIQRYMFTLYV